MVEFVYSEEKAIGIDEPIILENNTDAGFDVGVGIIFRKSGLYRVSVDGKHTFVEIEPERKEGKWIDTGSGQECSECLAIQYGYDSFRYFCPFCGADMRGEQNPL